MVNKKYGDFVLKNNNKMNDIKPPCGDNLGGLLSFKFIPVIDVLSIGTPMLGKITSEIQLKDGARWFNGYGTLGTMGFVEPSQLTPNGTFYQPSFTCICPQDGEENNYLFSEMSNQKFIIDIRDSNGLRKIVGTPDQGLFFSSSLNTQTDIGGRNAHSIVFYGDTTHKAYMYDI